MESWSLRWIRSLDLLDLTPNQRQIQIQSLNRSHSRSPRLRHNLTMNAQQHSLTMALSCMVTPVNHRNITQTTVAQTAPNAISLGLQAILIDGIQNRRPAAVYQSKRHQMPTTMAKRPRILKLVSVPRAALNAVGVGPRTIL